MQMIASKCLMGEKSVLVCCFFLSLAMEIDAFFVNVSMERGHYSAIHDTRIVYGSILHAVESTDSGTSFPCKIPYKNNNNSC